MIKNLGRFKQWTEERFGGAKVTLQTEDFQRLESETEQRREGYDHVVEAVNIVQSHLLKRKPSPVDNRSKCMPFEALGSCLSHHGYAFPDDSALGIALINLGRTESKIARLQEGLAGEIKRDYISLLNSGVQEYGDYDLLRKKLTSHRLDYDAKLSKLNKAKKEKPELEQEMQAARMKYEGTEHNLIQKMVYLQEFENEHKDALLRLIEAQCKYHSQAYKLLMETKNNWGQGHMTDVCSINIMARTSSQNSYHTISQEDLHHSRMSSGVEDYQSASYHSGSYRSNTHYLNDQAPPLPIKASFTREPEKFRKALFDFYGGNEDDISFKVDDVIRVIDEIDKGWWVGEANGKRGIFPVNYTEDFSSQSQLLLPLPIESASLSSEPTPTIATTTEATPVPATTNTTDQHLNPSSANLNRHSIPPVTNHSSISQYNLDNDQGSNQSLPSTLESIRKPLSPPPATTNHSSSIIDTTALPTNSSTPIEPSLYQPKSTAIKASPTSLIKTHNFESSDGDRVLGSPPPIEENPIHKKSNSANSSTSELPSTITGHHQQESQVIGLSCKDCSCHESTDSLLKKECCSICFHKHE